MHESGSRYPKSDWSQHLRQLHSESKDSWSGQPANISLQPTVARAIMRPPRLKLASLAVTSTLP